MSKWLAAVLMLALAMPGHAQSLPVNDPPPGPRTGMILGQVVDSAGTPVSEAVVQLTMPKYASSPAAPRGRVMADAEGRFFFSDLPAGEYYLQAKKDGYAPGEYGQRRAWGQSLRLPLEENQRTDVTLRVWKFAALGGTVVDEAGEAVVGVAVRALIKRVVAGRTQFGNTELVGEFVPSAITDDRGVFRLSQLSPGTYVVVVPSTQTTLPASFVASADPALRSELFFSGVNEVTLLGQARTQQIGDAAILTPNRGLIPPAPAADGRLLAYRTTFYPAATTAAMATPVTLGAGEERSDLSIALRPEPSVRVSGRLVTPDGSMPPPTTIRLTSDSLTDVARYRLPSGPDDAGFDTVTGMSDASGRFTLLGVPPGDYILTHGTRFLARATEQGNRAYWISQPVRVGADDIPNLTVELRPALRVEGRIEYRSPTGAKPSRVPGVMFETPFAEPRQFYAEASRDGTASFSTVAAGGQYIIRPYEVSGWVVQSVTAGGRDLTDRVFDLQADLTSIVVTMTDQPTKVSGVVRDAQGQASATAVVLAFPVDRGRWSRYGTSPRHLKSAITTPAGVYTFDHLPPGNYHVIAIDPSEADDWENPARLEALSGDAATLTIATGDTSKTLDLRVKAVR